MGLDMKREIKFEYGFESINGIVKKVYYLHEIPNIKDLCDVWDILPIAYVRQFTGLTDKNGKDIYEGDILTYQNGSGPKKVVEYNSEKGWYRCIFQKGGGFVDTIYYYIERDCEIIGNLFENPELL